MKITFPNGLEKDFEAGSTGYDIAKSISEGLAKNAVGVVVNEKIYDLTRQINEDATIRILTFDDAEGKAVFWHSSAHLMAEALQSLYPGVKFGIGPSIENGFYYDVELPGDIKLSIDDLPKIEAKMTELSKAASSFIREEKDYDSAMTYFKGVGDQYKIELIEGLVGQNISFYHSGAFTDLCRGPHLPNASMIKYVKLYAVAGAYWRGDEKRKMLTRIYGVSFPKKQMLDEFVRIREEAEKRDHRKIGKELELFAFSQNVGAGLPLWLPKGAVLRELLEAFLKKMQKMHGYEQVITPHIGQKELYITSGHWAKYGKDSFRPITTPQEGEEFMLKPMNCPHHCEIYKTKPRSYRDLPLRFAEFGTVYRYEQSGELHGLTRVRGFTQDDAHLFCRPDQLQEEFEKVIDIVLNIFKALDFKEFTAQISLRDPKNTEKYIGSDENWEKAQSAIITAAEKKGLNTVLVEGEAAFYGPKLDFMVKDALSRKWQLGTIQVDYNLPERFDLEYVDQDNQRRRPVMIHRAPFGSMERFVAVLIEHYAGNFPFWISPVQATILPISEAQKDKAVEIFETLESLGFRTKIDLRNEKINRKIAESEQKKVPFALIIGQKELENNTISVRKHGEGDKGSISLEEIISQFKALNIPGAK